MSDWRSQAPLIFGAILDGLSSALRHQADCVLESYERLADVEQWVAAAEPGLGWEPGTFSQAYRRAQQGKRLDNIDNNPVARIVVKLMQTREEISGRSVGLACARALARRGLWVIVLEAAGAIGQGISSRNSEVIHAGIYYPAGSLKAVLCVKGRRQLYRYADEKGFEARALGKLIVAANAGEHAKLDALMASAKANDVEGLEMLTGRQATALEPNLVCSAALHSPVSGIVDSHAFMLSLQGDFEDAGGMIAFNTPVVGGAVGNNSIRIEAGGTEPTSVTTRVLVNSAGLHAPAIARSFDGLDARHIPKSYLCKGSYFGLASGKAPFTKLIYPLPNEAGLGIHSTTDLGGQNRFGPDTEWIDTEDYQPSTNRLSEFEQVIRRYYPQLAEGDLTPNYAGIRPKIVGPGEAAADFVIQDETVHAVPGLINLFGIESPGLTASLAIGDKVAEALT